MQLEPKALNASLKLVKINFRLFLWIEIPLHSENKVISGTQLLNKFCPSFIPRYMINLDEHVKWLFLVSAPHILLCYA